MLNTTILMIRHAEKPDNGPLLAVPGQERAQAYTVYFPNYPAGSASLSLNYLFACADSNDSQRPRLTIQPLGKTLGLTVQTPYKDKDYAKLVTLLQSSTYDNVNILICWHHEEILAFAQALGVAPGQLPAGANWPASWPGDVYGWLLQLAFDSNGNIDTTKTFCINENLMFDDNGNNPPRS